MSALTRLELVHRCRPGVDEDMLGPHVERRQLSMGCGIVTILTARCKECEDAAIVVVAVHCGSWESVCARGFPAIHTLNSHLRTDPSLRTDALQPDRVFETAMNGKIFASHPHLSSQLFPRLTAVFFGSCLFLFGVRLGRRLISAFSLRRLDCIVWESEANVHHTCTHPLTHCPIGAASNLFTSIRLTRLTSSLLLSSHRPRLQIPRYRAQEGHFQAVAR